MNGVGVCRLPFINGKMQDRCRRCGAVRQAVNSEMRYVDDGLKFYT
jgi:hypothetical protein